MLLVIIKKFKEQKLDFYLLPFANCIGKNLKKKRMPLSHTLDETSIIIFLVCPVWMVITAKKAYCCSRQATDKFHAELTAKCCSRQTADTFHAEHTVPVGRLQTYFLPRILL